MLILQDVFTRHGAKRVGLRVGVVSIGSTIVLASAGVALVRMGPPRPSAVVPASAEKSPTPISLSGFEKNLGQDPGGALFVARTPDYVLNVTADGVILTLRGQRSSPQLRLSVVGAQKSAPVEGTDPRPGVVNSLVGNDPARWRTGIPTFGGVAYHEILPNVDMLYRAGAEFEYDFDVAPGGDPGSIWLQVAGADSLRLDDAGDLILKTAAGLVRHHRPSVYQDVDGRRVAVDARYRMRRGEVGFDVGHYDHARPLVIDPVISFSAQVPGGGASASKIVSDAAGASYVAGSLTSASGATTNLGKGASDAFVAKFKPDGTLEYLTVLGGDNDDSASSIAVDGTATVAIAGSTHSGNFPVSGGAFKKTHLCAANPCQNDLLGMTAFVTTLDGTGQLGYSTYFGGQGPDEGMAVSFGPGGAVVTAGVSWWQTEGSGPFPTKSAFQPGPCGCTRRFGWVARFDPSASDTNSLSYSSLITYSKSEPAPGETVPQSVAVDAQGSAYVAGFAGPGIMTTNGSIQRSISSGFSGFLLKVSPDGASLAYGTYLGADGSAINDVAVDGAGNALITGRTKGGYPLAGNPYQASAKGPQDAFFAKVSPAGTVLAYSTYLGGSGSDSGQAIAVDASGTVLVAGSTDSSDFPAVNPISGQTATGGFVTKFNTAVQPPVVKYSTTIAGSAIGVAFGPSRSAYVATSGGLVMKLVTLPVITALSQTGGPTAGGTSMTITGTDLAGAQSVSFGTATVPCGASSPCQNDQQAPDTTLRLAVPAHMPETVDVRVTTADGTSALVPAGRYTYRPPVLSAVDVAKGPATGGTAVRLSGTDLQGSSVTFGANAATGVSVTPDGTGISLMTPASDQSGAAAVRVTTPPGATADLASTFTYLPAITGLLPPSAPLTGGGSLVISGRGLTGATDVRFGSTSTGAAVAAPGRPEIVVNAIPAHTTAEAVAITVTVQGLDSVAVPAGANTFTYTNPPPAPPPTTPNNGAGSTNDNQPSTPPATPPTGVQGTAPNPGSVAAPTANTPAANVGAPVPGSGSGSVAASPGAAPPAATPGATPSPASAAPPPAPAAPPQAAPVAPPSGQAPLSVAAASPPAPPVPAAPVPGAPSAAAPAASPPPVAPPGAAGQVTSPGASPVGPPPGPLDPGNAGESAPGYAMVGQRQASPAAALYLGLSAIALAVAFGCLVVTDRRRHASSERALAYARSLGDVPVQRGGPRG